MTSVGEYIDSLRDSSSSTQRKVLAQKFCTGWTGSPSDAIAELTQGLEDESESVRIGVLLAAALLVSDEITLREFQDMARMASGDWSGKVKRFGLSAAFSELWTQFPQALCVLFENSPEPALSKTLLVGLATVIGKSGYEDLADVAVGLIESNIDTLEPEVQEGMITLLNSFGLPRPESALKVIRLQVDQGKTRSFHVIREVLDRRFGKSFPSETREDLLERMNTAERTRSQVVSKLLVRGRSKTTFQEVTVSSMLHWINVRHLPFNYGANPYRGCQHACLYCSARNTHEYLGCSPDDFEHFIMVKVNAPQALARQLRSPRWQSRRNRLVNLGSVTDPYQPCELKFGITREMLKVFREFNTPVTLATKSDLVLRDLDLIAEMAKSGLLSVQFTIHTLDEELAKVLEKGAKPVRKRLQAIETLKKEGITVGVLMIPIIPLVNDSQEELTAVAVTLHDLGVDYVIPDLLNLRGDVRQRLLPELEKRFPGIQQEFQSIYTAGRNDEYANKAYAKQFFDFMMKDLLKRLDLRNYDRMVKGKWDNP